MGCCNDKRVRWATAVPGAPRSQAFSPGVMASDGTPPVSTVGFAYVGVAALSVRGPVTRAHYRFAAPGARVEVDARDAAYMTAVPHLRRV